MSDVLIRVEGFGKTYRVRDGAGRPVEFAAVTDVSFEVHRGETLGLIGESGSGKTTTGRLLLRLERPTAGSAVFDGIDLSALPERRMRTLRQRMQMVFQDNGSAFNPRIPVGAQIAHGARLFGAGAGEARDRADALVERVGLPAADTGRYIHEFSGGQRQRLGIARALATQPDFLVLDEPTAALDVSTQAQVLNLLKDLQAEMGLTMLLITHNLALIEHMCDRAAVMDAGRIVEQGDVDRLFTAPESAMTKRLLAAVLEPDIVE